MREISPLIRPVRNTLRSASWRESALGFCSGPRNDDFWTPFAGLPESCRMGSVAISEGRRVYTALAYYHANRDEVEAELAADDAEYDALKSQPN